MSYEEGTGCGVAYSIAFDTIQIAYKNGSIRVRSELGLKFSGDLCPAAQAKNMEVRDIRLTTIHHLIRSDAHWQRHRLHAVPQIGCCEDGFSP